MCLYYIDFEGTFRFVASRNFGIFRETSVGPGKFVLVFSLLWGGRFRRCSGPGVRRHNLWEARSDRDALSPSCCGWRRTISARSSYSSIVPLIVIARPFNWRTSPTDFRSPAKDYHRKGTGAVVGAEIEKGYPVVPFFNAHDGSFDAVRFAEMFPGFGHREAVLRVYPRKNCPERNCCEKDWNLNDCRRKTRTLRST